MITNHLLSGFFQLGYVTRDLDMALAEFQKRFGKTEFLSFPTEAPPDTPALPSTRIALAYIGDTMIEIIEVNPENPFIYRDSLPTEAGDIQLHHLGYLVDDHDETLAQLDAAGHEIVWAGVHGEQLGYIYADLRKEVGHYVEYIHLRPVGEAFFKMVPRNERPAR